LLQDPIIPLGSGQKYYTEKIENREFRIAAPSFFQVNTKQAECLVDLLREKLALSGDGLLVDAYAGVGTFAAVLAPHAHTVIAVEESSSAIKDARANSQDILNVEFRMGKTEDVLGQMRETPEAVILDPPRSGCHPRVLEALNKLMPNRIVYVSCDPDTLARDLRVLHEGPFQLVDVQPVDMFPQTYHVECVATLVLNEKKKTRLERHRRLVLASKSPRRRRILEDMNLTFEVISSGESEESVNEGSPVEFAEGRALAKANKVASSQEGGMVVGADTIVVDLESDLVMGKPATLEEATSMLRRLRGKEHRVITGVAVVDAESGKALVDHCISHVVMRNYSDEDIGSYVSSGSPFDKAGGYAVQDPVLRPAKEVEGCYLNVVGLPPCTLAGLLAKLGVQLQPDPLWTSPGRCPDCRRLADVTEVGR
jgi:23S rRNA (uracil1939-C5)-methyltransferase